MIVSFVLLGLGKAYSPTSLTAAKIRLSRILGHGSILALNKKPLPPRHFFHVSSFESNRIPMKNAVEENRADAKKDKNRAGIKPKITRSFRCCVILFWT